MSQPEPRGFTLIEVVIASTLLVVISLVVVTMSKSGLDAQDYSRRMQRVTEVTQELTETLREDAQSSVRLFGNDAIGNAYTALLDLSGLPPMLAGSRLPEIDGDATFESESQPGVTSSRTGNRLLFARFAWSDEFLADSGVLYRIDIYRLVCHYLAPVDGGPRAGQNGGIDFVRWVSEPLADGNQIDNIADATDREEVCEHLRLGSADAAGRSHTPVSLVWKVGEAPALNGTLRQIVTDGELSDEAVGSRALAGIDWIIYPDLERTVPGLLAVRQHAVASNHAARICGVGRFGRRANDDTFPHGFETQIIGPAAARQILIHLSLVSSRPGRLAYHRNQVVVDARDL